MAAAVVDRNTPYKEGDNLSIPLKAGVKVLAGTIAVSDGGYGNMGATSATLIALGIWNQTVDNTLGANGAVSAVYVRGKAFLLQNDGVDPVAQADVGKQVFMEDNQTVAKTNGAATRSALGILVAVEARGAWVRIS